MVRPVTTNGHRPAGSPDGPTGPRGTIRAERLCPVCIGPGTMGPMGVKKRRVEGEILADDGIEMVGPFAIPDPTGVWAVIPKAMTAGPPKPEPDERWTLGPGSPSTDEPPDDAYRPAGDR